MLECPFDYKCPCVSETRGLLHVGIMSTDTAHSPSAAMQRLCTLCVIIMYDCIGNVNDGVYVFAVVLLSAWFCVGNIRDGEEIHDMSGIKSSYLYKPAFLYKNICLGLLSKTCLM